MFQKFEIQGLHDETDKKLHTYIDRKIGNLDRYVSRHARDSARAEVHIKETKQKGEQHSFCEVKITLPQHRSIIVKETAINMYAAIDITEAKIKQQLQKYKETHASGKLHRHLFNRFRGSLK